MRIHVVLAALLFVALFAGQAAAQEAAPERAAEKSGSDKMFWVDLLGGGGFAAAENRDDQQYFEGHAGLDVEVYKGLFVGATYEHRRYEVEYSTLLPRVAGRPTYADESVTENWIDGRITISYNTLAEVTDLLSFYVGVAPRMVAFDSDGYSNWFFAPEGFAKLVVPVHGGLSVEGGFQFAANVVSEDAERSIEGPIKWIYGYHAGLNLDFGTDRLASLVLMWQGQIVVYDFAERMFNGGLFGVRLGF